MPFSIWATLLGASLLISFTPGAGAINTMTNSLNVGHRRTLWGVLGLQTALVIQLVIVAAGLGVVVANSEVLFSVIRYAGAAYLVYLGVRQFFRKPDLAVDGEAPATESAWALYRRGVFVNLLNPKAIVFFLAFIPGFVRPALPLWPQYVVIAATIVAVDIMVMWLFFAPIARGFQRFTRNESGQRILNRVFGVLFIGVGLMLAVM